MKTRLVITMAKLVRIFLGFLPILLLGAFPVFAYEVALKDGRIIQFQKYRVARDKLYYIAADEREQSVQLITIDVERTRELNAKEVVPLELPGLVAQARSETTDSQAASLGEIARQLRAKRVAEEQIPTKHTYSSDDFAPAEPTEEVMTPASGVQGNFQTWRAMAVRFQAQYHAMEIEPQQEAIKRPLGSYSESKFPERDSWERRFLAVRGNFLRTLQMCMSDRPSDSEEKPKACSRAVSQQYDYDTLQREGLKLAMYWDHYQSEKR
jgi:hypothetical protein